MIRACSDCPNPISDRSGGRCRSCSRKAANRTPEMREAARAAISQKNADPDFQVVAHISQRAHFKWCPREYRDLNRKMASDGFNLSERRRIIQDDIDVRLRRLKARAA